MPAASAPPNNPADLAERAMDPKNLSDVERAIQQLSPDEAQHFLKLLERGIKRRKIQMVGYMLALIVLLLGQFGAIVYYGAADEGTFVGWVFFLPFLAVGLVFWLFGRWARRLE
jgi:hypothetical protein